MEKEPFIQVLHHFTNSSSEQAKAILSLKESYPYCQVLHVLSARLSQDHGFSNRQDILQLAAVYAADRAVLKETMAKVGEQPTSWPTSHEVKGQVHPELPESISAPIHAVDDSSNLADELLVDLQRLSALKTSFEAMFTDSVNTESYKEPSTQDPSKDKVEVDSQLEKEKTSKKKRSGKTKAQRIIELAQSLQSPPVQSSKIDDPQEVKGIDGTGEGIIEEIKTSKKKIQPEGVKQKEQLEIIEQFIKAQPTISPAKDKTPIHVQSDLSVFKSGEFGDNVISETLVEILLRQGKKDKAIEVLKKLIWKFPQKKAYFAAQIEELKK